MFFTKTTGAIIAALPLVSAQNNMLRTRILTDPDAECPDQGDGALFGCTLWNLDKVQAIAPLPTTSFKLEEGDSYSIECKASQLEDPNFYFKYNNDQKTENKAPFWINGNKDTYVNPVPDLTRCDEEFKLYVELRNGYDDCKWDVFTLTPKCGDCGCPDNSMPIDPNNVCPTSFDECECKPGFIPDGEVCVCPDGYELDGDKCVPCSCPDNSMPVDGVTCPRSADDCVCVDGYEKDGDKCVPCSCPDNSMPADGVTCPSTADDCVCVEGYKKDGDQCVPCTCPENSMPADGVTCPNTPDDCVCVEGYEKDGDDCVPETCPSNNLICQDKPGDMKYLTYRVKDGKCEAKCEDKSKSLEIIAKYGFTCDPCAPPSCPTENICEQKDGKTKYNLYRTKSDGDCEVKCEEPKNFPDKFKDGYSCDPCEEQEPGDDLCPTCGKPLEMIMMYTGNDNNDNSQQEGKTSVSGAVNGATSVYIVVNDDEDKNDGDQYFAGAVQAGETFNVSSNGDKFSSNTWFKIYASQGGTLLQKVQMHTSCSAPLGKNDQFGSVMLVGYTSEKGVCFSPEM